MSLEMFLWLITGKLKSLRDGRIRVSGVDPLTDFIWYAVKLCLYWVFMVPVGFLTAIGCYELALKAMDGYRFPPSPELFRLIVLMGIIGGIFLFCGFLIIAALMSKTFKRRRFKSQQFINDVYGLLHGLTVKDVNDLSFLTNQNGPTLVLRTCGAIQSHAIMAVRSEEQGLIWNRNLQKTKVKELYETAKRLGILDESYPLPFFYKCAQAVVKAEKTEANVEAKHSVSSEAALA